jgi:hypothetical protein
MNILFVLKSFMRKRLIAKSNEWRSDFKRGHASVPYNRIGRHLLATNLITTSSEAKRPTRPYTALSDLWNARFAWSKEHLNRYDWVI